MDKRERERERERDSKIMGEFEERREYMKIIMTMFDCKTRKFTTKVEVENRCTRNVISKSNRWHGMV